MNLILLRNGYPLTIFSPEAENRSVYFDALNTTRDTEDHSHFERFVAQNVKQSCFDFLAMLAPNIGEENEQKGYYYFKKIEPFLPKKL